MTANDVDDVFAVLNLNLGEYFAPEVIQFFLAQWPDGQFVAESLTGQVVGALCGSKLAGNRASVSLLAVDSSVRGMGAGTSLMASLRRACMMNGIGTIQLEVRTTNVWSNPSSVDAYRTNSYSSIYQTNVIVASGSEFRATSGSARFSSRRNVPRS